MRSGAGNSTSSCPLSLEEKKLFTKDFMSDETSKEEELDEEEQESSSDGMCGDSGCDFLKHDFSETYEKYHAESLQNMTKQELIHALGDEKNCLKLKAENQRLEREKELFRQESRCLENRK
ncbi:protein HEXIM1-like [Mustelus asterias]